MKIRLVKAHEHIKRVDFGGEKRVAVARRNIFTGKYIQREVFPGAQLRLSIGKASEVENWPLETRKHAKKTHRRLFDFELRCVEALVKNII